MTALERLRQAAESERAGTPIQAETSARARLRTLAGEERAAAEAQAAAASRVPIMPDARPQADPLTGDISKDLAAMRDNAVDARISKDASFGEWGYTPPTPEEMAAKAADFDVEKVTVLQPPKTENLPVRQAPEISVRTTAEGARDALKSAGKIALGAAATGMETFNNQILKTVNLVTGGMAQAAVNESDERLESQRQYLSDATGENKVVRAAGDVLSSAVAALPQAALAIMSGGASLMTGANTLAPQGISAVQTLAQGFAKNPQYWLSFATTVGSDYEDAKDWARNDAEAAMYAVMTSLINAGVEIGGDGMSGIQGVAAKLKQGDKGALRTWLGTMLDEGKEEIVQGAISRAMSGAMGKDTAQLFSVKNPDAVFNPLVMAQEGAMGAAVGGLLGGGQIGVSALLDTGRAPVEGARHASEQGISPAAEQSGTERRTAPQNESVPDPVISAMLGEDSAAPTASVMLSALERVRSGGTVTNAQARAVAEDDGALRFLGIDKNGKSASALRGEIKARLSELAAAAETDAPTNSPLAEGGQTGYTQSEYETPETGVQIPEGEAKAGGRGTAENGTRLEEGSRGAPESRAGTQTEDGDRPGVPEGVGGNRGAVQQAPAGVQGKQKVAESGGTSGLARGYAAPGNDGVRGPGVHQGGRVLSAPGEVKEDGNGQKETVSDPGHAESTGGISQADTGAKGSRRSRYESRIKEILRKHAASSSGRNRERSARVERKETRNDFEDRMRADGYFYAETKNGGAAMGFKPAPEESWSSEAKAAQETLAKWGFEVIVFDGEMHTNRKGVSEVSTEGQTLRDGRDITIFLSSDLDIDGMETAYHEALHAIRTGPNVLHRVKIENIILDNIDMDSAEFESFVTRIADLYAYAVQDVSEERFAAEIMEEFYAWYVGKLHASDAGVWSREINAFSDAETVKAGIDAIYAKMEVATEPTSQSAEAAAEETPAPAADDGLGAANAGFSDPVSAETDERYFDLGAEYGTIEAGEERRVREAAVPRQTEDGKNVSEVVRTAMEAAATPDEALQPLRQAVVDGGFSYATITDKAAKRRAYDKIHRKGWREALADWRADVRAGKVSKDLTTLGLTLYNHAVNAGDMKTAVSILTDLTESVRSGAQAVQAVRILKKLRPRYKLYAYERTVANLNEKLGEGAVKIDEEHAEAVMSAKTEKERADAEKALCQHIADQVPATWADKLNAWRYLAMLCNPATHIRNTGGNVMFLPVRLAKRGVEVGLQTLAAKGGLIDGHTVSLLDMTSAKDRALALYAWADSAAMTEDMLSGGKYNDEASKINNRRTIFKIKPLEALRKANSKALEKEDKVFSRLAYAESLAARLKAKGVTADMLDASEVPEDVLTAAREAALKDAQEATFRDINKFSSAVARLGKTGFKPIDIAVEGVIPFKRTPANILVRAFEYSPAGLTKGIWDMAVKVKRGDVDAVDAISEIAAGLTGTCILGLGALFAKLGWVTGGGSGDDKQDSFDELRGAQDYALVLGETSYTLSWVAPAALPFFVGVELYNALTRDGLSGDEAWDAALGITEPLLELSMLQGVSDLIDNVAFSENKFQSLVVSAYTSILGQLFPTLGGQIERTLLEDTRQTTFVDRTSAVPRDLQRALGKVANKIPIPGVDVAQMEYVDAWGRTESTGSLGQRVFRNFLSPGYVSEEAETPVDAELQRLYDAGQKSVFPSRPSYSEKVTKDDETRFITADEYFEYATVRGQTSLDLIDVLINLDSYTGLSDKEKADAIGSVYDFATMKAQDSIGEDDSAAKWLRELDGENDTEIAKALAYHALMLTYKDSTSAEEKADIAASGGDGFAEFRISQLGDSTQERYRECIGSGVSPAEVMAVHDVKETKGNKQEQVREKIERTVSGSRQRRALWLAMGYSEKTCPWA